MKNKQEKLILEISRLHELMYIGKNLINEQLGEEVATFFKSIFHTSAVDKAFAKEFSEGFEHLKVNDEELINKIKRQIGHDGDDISFNDLSGLTKVTSIKSSTLVETLEELQSKLVTYIFNKNTKESIEVANTLIETTLSRAGNENKKNVYDYIVNLAQNGNKEEMELAMKKYQPYFPSYWFDHIRNSKYVQSTLDAMNDYAAQVVDDTIDGIAKTGKKIKDKGMLKLLFNSVAVPVEKLLDGIVYLFPKFNRTKFIRGYKLAVTNKEMEKFIIKSKELNEKYLKLIAAGDQEGLQQFEKELTKFLGSTYSWVLSDQTRMLNYWKEELFKLAKEGQTEAKQNGDDELAREISKAVDEFFGVQTSQDGKIVKVDDATRNVRSSKLQKEIDYALSISGEQSRYNKMKYNSAMQGFGNLLKFGFAKNGEGLMKWGQRFIKFMAYGEPRLFQETADNIIMSGGIHGYWKTELRRRVLFACAYWYGAYTLQDFLKAYAVGTDVVDKDGNHSLGYNAAMWLGGPNTKWPENRVGGGKFMMFARWLGMSTINYYGIHSDWFTEVNPWLRGDKEWSGLNTPTPEEWKTNPKLALEKENRRGSLLNKFVESPIISLYNRLEYINARNAQTTLEAADRQYKDLHINSLTNDPNFKTLPPDEQKKLKDSLEKALDVLKPKIMEAQQKAAQDLTD